MLEFEDTTLSDAVKQDVIARSFPTEMARALLVKVGRSLRNVD
jgi:hypothetical protein